MIKEFISSSSLKELLVKRNTLGDTSILIAGGTELRRLDSPAMKDEQVYLSLDGLGLDTISVKDDGIYIGSMVTLQQIVDSSDVPPWIQEAAHGAGSRTLRNMATIGGNIGAFRDDSYLIPACIAAKVRVLTADIREDGDIIEDDVPIREFIENFSSFRSSCITNIAIKKLDRCVLVKRYSRTAQRRPDAAIAFGADCSDETIKDIRIAVGGLGLGITRLHKVEDGIMNQSLQTYKEIRQVVDDTIDPVQDITGSAAYKQYLVSITLADMLQTCVENAEGGPST